MRPELWGALILALIGTACGVSVPHAAAAFPTRTPLPTFTPLATDTPFPTDTPVPTAALPRAQPTVAFTPQGGTPPGGTLPGGTPLPRWIPVPTATATPSPWRVVERAQVYAGPGADYAVVASLEPGTAIAVTARSPDEQWLYVAAPVQGWVAAGAVEVDPLAALAVLTPPPTAVPTATGVSIPSFMGGSVPVDVQVQVAAPAPASTVVVTTTPHPTYTTAPTYTPWVVTVTPTATWTPLPSPTGPLATATPPPSPTMHQSPTPLPSPTPPLSPTRPPSPTPPPIPTATATP